MVSAEGRKSKWASRGRGQEPGGRRQKVVGAGLKMENGRVSAGQ